MERYFVSVLRWYPLRQTESEQKQCSVPSIYCHVPTLVSTFPSVVSEQVLVEAGDGPPEGGDASDITPLKDWVTYNLGQVYLPPF